MFGWVALAVAAEPAEEVLVWGDPFARWERRWSVRTEIGFPKGLMLAEEVNRELELRGIQVQAVLDCEVDFVLGPQSREVSCRIEDIGLIGRPYRPQGNALRVIQSVDDSLTGATLQLQVRAAGQVPDVDLEGIEAGTDREQDRVELLRQLVSRVILPFHLQLPDAVSEGSSWYEHNSRLFELPSDNGTVGSSMIAHYLDRLDPEHLVVQSIGRAVMNAPSSTVYVLQAQNYPGQATPFVDFWIPPTDQMVVEMHGVAIIDRASGILTERVWVVSGEYSASSPNALAPGGWHHTGRLRMLAQGERVDVGPTLVTRMSDDEADRPVWIPMEP